jgi:AcrR family transcriptional regulator
LLIYDILSHLDAAARRGGNTGPGACLTQRSDRQRYDRRVNKRRSRSGSPALPPEFGSPYLNAWSLPRGQHGHNRDTIVASQRARMLYAMIRLSAEKGYSEVTIANVVALAGVSRTTFYSQFTDRENCFIAAYDACHFALVQAVLGSQRDGMSWDERLDATVRAYLRYCQERPHMLRAILVQIHAAGVRAWEHREAAHDRFARMQRALYELRRQERSGLPDLPHETFRGCVAAVEEMVSVYERRGWTERIMELEPAVKYLLQSVYGGLDAAGRPEPQVPRQAVAV